MFLCLLSHPRFDVLIAAAVGRNNVVVKRLGILVCPSEIARKWPDNCAFLTWQNHDFNRKETATGNGRPKATGRQFVVALNF